MAKKADFKVGNRLFISGTYRALRWARFLPVSIGPLYIGRHLWQVAGWRGVTVGVFRWCCYVGVVRL